MQMIKLSVIALAVAAASTQMAVASQQSESNGFIEDSSLNAHARALYFNRDFRDDRRTSAQQSYREESGLGLKAIYESGFTQGTVGFGVDAFGLQGIKLDSGKGRHSNTMFPTERNGRAKDNYSQAGGAVKARISSTTLKYGEQFVDLPVLSTDDSRLLPQTATGFLVTSNEIANLEMHAGHFTALTAMDAVSHDSNSYELEDDVFGTLKSLDLVGARYNFTENLSAAYYYADSDVKFNRTFDVNSKKHYVNANYTLPLADTQSLNFDFNMYKSKFDTAGESADRNNAFSIAAAYNLDAHTFTVGYQRMSGDEGYKYGYDGGGSVYLLNDVQYNDFTQKDEKSYQVRYDLNMDTLGVPGLSFMTRYVRGSDVDVDNGIGGYVTQNGKNWERDIQAQYVLQNGPAKDLSFRLRQATYRAESAVGTDVDEVRLIVEYPLSIL